MVETFSMSSFISIIIKFNMKEKIHASEQGSHCFQYENYAQITSKQFHLLFVCDDNKSNNGQIG